MHMETDNYKGLRPLPPTPGHISHWAKQQGPEGRTEPPGNGSHCLTLLSEPTRKLALFQPSRLTNGALATAKQQGPEGRTEPPGNGSHCLTLLTLLSEATRKLALFQPSRLTNGALATAKQQGPEGRTEPPGNGSQTSSLPAVKAHKRRLRHSKTAGPWRTDRASGQRLPLPNVAFWTYKKTSSLPAVKAHKRRLRHSKTAGPWRTPGNGSHCLTLLSEPTRKLALFQPSRLTNGALATAKQQGPEGRTEPPGNGSQTSSLPAVKAHKRRLRHSKTAGPWRTDRASGQRLPVPNVAFWTYKKTSSLPAVKAHKRRPRHSKTAGPWRTDRASGQRLPN